MFKNHFRTPLSILLTFLLLFSLAACTQQAVSSADAKDITVQVVYADGTDRSIDISTDEDNLRGALEQEDLIKGTESEYGLYVLTVDGVTADESKQEWWCFTKDGQSITTGVDDTPIEDGDHFEITLTTGW